MNSLDELCDKALLDLDEVLALSDDEFKELTRTILKYNALQHASVVQAWRTEKTRQHGLIMNPSPARDGQEIDDPHEAIRGNNNVATARETSSSSSSSSIRPMIVSPTPIKREEDENSDATRHTCTPDKNQREAAEGGESYREENNGSTPQKGTPMKESATTTQAHFDWDDNQESESELSLNDKNGDNSSIIDEDTTNLKLTSTPRKVDKSDDNLLPGDSRGTDTASFTSNPTPSLVQDAVLSKRSAESSVINLFGKVTAAPNRSNLTTGPTAPQESTEDKSPAPRIKARFPASIATGPRNAMQRLRQLSNGQLVSIESLSVADQRKLYHIWPQNTPVPESSGGFCERRGKGSQQYDKTTSNVARLIGTLTVSIRLLSDQLKAICVYEVGEIESGSPIRYVLAEQILDCAETAEQFSCLSAESLKVFKAIASLNDKDNHFKDRCVHVLSEVVRDFEDFAENMTIEQPIVSLIFHVYARRALFGLSHNHNIKVLMDALEPLPPPVEPWKKCRPIPKSTNVFRKSPLPNCGAKRRHGRLDHSLQGLLWENENEGYPLIGQEKKLRGIKVKLHDYQKESVAWMACQENLDVTETGGGVPGLNGYFWERRSFAKCGGIEMFGDVYYYFPIGGSAYLTPPPTTSGGLLAEEMGLGKTVETLQLICSDAKTRPKERGSTLGGTLVVIPVTLLAQWESEVGAKAPGLSLYSYYNDGTKNEILKENRNFEVDDSLYCTEPDADDDEEVVEEEDSTNTTENSQSRGDDLAHAKDDTPTTPDMYVQVSKQVMAAYLATYDVVLTTMEELRRGTFSSVLNTIEWHRMVVDECQFLKNDTTAIAKAASYIDATHRWMLSGTPLTNKLDDLRGELSLLRIWPFTLGTASDATWESHFWTEIKSGWDSHNGRSIPLINHLMSAISMRHSRLQTRTSNNSSLVVLPERSDKFVEITVNDKLSESFVCRWLEAAVAALLKQLERTDISICGLLGVIRQVASSASLLSLTSIETIINDLDHNQTVDHKRRRISEVEDSPNTSSGCSPYAITYKDAAFSFQYCTSLVHTLESIQNLPRPQKNTHQKSYHKKVQDMCAKLPTLPKMLAEHIAASTYCISPKVKAISDEIRKIRASSLEAKICIFSSFIGVLDEIESTLDTVKYCIEYDMNHLVNLRPGQRVMHAITRRQGVIVSCMEVLSDNNTNTQDRAKRGGQTSSKKTKLYSVCFEPDIEGSNYFKREDLKVVPVTVNHVPASLVCVPGKRFIETRGRRVSVNGSTDRLSLSVGSSVESKRPAVPSLELQVGYSVDIVSANGSEPEKGRIVKVRHCEDKKSILYDVRPDGYERVQIDGSEEQIRKSILKHVPPELLIDRGSRKWTSATIRGISNSSSNPHTGRSTSSSEDAIGYVRIDGRTNGGFERTEVLNSFQTDPMISVILLTKRAAGVGLNLTCANHVFIAEPSLDPHDEEQSIYRVHRIGQSRPVSVRKFYVKGTIEERILKRRQQRGELSISINATAGTEGSSSPEAESEDMNGVSSSISLSFKDLKLLLGL